MMPRIEREVPSVLVTGDFAWSIYEPDFCEGLRAAGATVTELPVLRFFGPGRALRSLQGKLLEGPGPWLANRALERECRRVRPRVILAWRAPWLTISTIQACQSLGSRVILYNNDDPFGPDQARRIWRVFRGLVPHADACFAYRRANVPEYLDAGARQVDLLRSWFNPKVHRPVVLSQTERTTLACDCVFVGHAEDDGRLESMKRLQDAGLSVRIYGSGWETKLGPLGPHFPSWGVIDGATYARVLLGAKIGLVFLSARNRDDYTRRCFEIPAVGAFMLAPRTAELQAMYREGEEAVYFSGAGELVEQAIRYCNDDFARSQIAQAGHRRCLGDGNDVVSRAKGFLVSLRNMFPELPGLTPPGVPAAPGDA